jgi:hypothetical protein
MNPTLLKHLEDIESGVHAIGERLEDARSQATHQVEERERLQQEAWSKQREAATLKRLGEDNAALTEENALFAPNTTGTPHAAQSTPPSTPFPPG